MYMVDTQKCGSNGTLEDNEYMTILVKFPQGTFNAHNKIDKNFNYYLNMAEEGATHYNMNEKDYIYYN